MELLLVVFGIFGAFVFYSYFISGQEKKEIKIEIQVQTPEPNKELKSSDYYFDKDNWEQFNFYGSEMLPATGNYHIVYIDQRGMTTERNISIKRAYNDSGKYAVNAMCHLRGAHRSFIDDRIQKAIDTDTGEIVDSVAKHSIQQYENTEVGQMWKAIGGQSVYLYVLCFICKADGRMLKAERNLIAEFIKTRCPDIVFNDIELDNAVKTMGAPDFREFKRLIIKMRSEDLDTLKQINEYSKRIVATQKSIDPLEKAALDTLDHVISNA